jgi:adenylate cyclase
MDGLLTQKTFLFSTNPLARKVAAGLLLGVGAAALVLLLGWTESLDTLESKSYDWRMRRIRKAAPSASQDIVLVEISDSSIRNLMPLVGRWPWPRVLHSMLIDYLQRGHPRVIALDIALLEPERDSTYTVADEEWTSAKSDQTLADAVARAGNVIVLADAVNPGMLDPSDNPQAVWKAPPYRLGPAIEERPVITLPYDSLAAAVAAFGHNFLALDPDGPARRMAPFIRQGNRFMPALGIAAALQAARIPPEQVVLEGDAIRVGDRHIPLVPVRVPDAANPSKHHVQQTMLINYSAPTLVNGKRPYPSFDVAMLLQSEGMLRSGERPSVDPAVFKDKIVFVGLTASGLVDVFQTPFGQGVMPGIQLHASMADSVLANRFIRVAPERSRIAATLAAGVVTGLMAAMLPFTAAAAGAVVGSGGWALFTSWALERGVWTNMVQPLLAIAVALFGGTAYRYFVEGREKRKVKRLFGRYVSKDVYEQLVANPGLAELGGRRREMSVLFSDIRGFTTMSESGNPEQLVAQLNEYFSRMVAVVFRHKGTVDKFVGDMVMALFSAPLDDPDHAEHAVTAAVEMVHELGELNRKWTAEGRGQLDIGIGINSGDMIAGNIGSAAIMSYTVIGDNVNLGSRLESLNKEYKTRIIISDATRTRLKASYDIRPLGDTIVKGKSRPVAIFEIRVASPLQATPARGVSAGAGEPIS